MNKEFEIMGNSILREQTENRRLRLVLLEIKDLACAKIVQCKSEPCFMCQNKCFEYAVCQKANEVLKNG